MDKFLLPKLEFKLDALQPIFSAEAVEFHYLKHHQTYVSNLNKLISGTIFESLDSVEKIMLNAKGGLLNNAAQHWNHSFYWKCISPKNNSLIPQTLQDKIILNFGSLEKFKDLFSQTAISTFGSGWAWMVQNPNGSLSVVSTKDATNPLESGSRPLLTCDVWEHAYYIDYRNERSRYVNSFWDIIDWEFVNQNLTTPFKL